MKSMMIRTYSDLIRLNTFEERYEYLKLKGSVGKSTFGFDRYINQQFYRSTQWKSIRNFVIARDQGLDLAFEGYEIYDRIIIHHMNPMSVEDIEHGDDDILNPEFLICTTHKTHNAIHYGDKNLLALPFVERTINDTKLW
jgi:hypothetical protein